jgi:hypothetical protein
MQRSVSPQIPLRLLESLVAISCRLFERPSQIYHYEPPIAGSSKKFTLSDHLPVLVMSGRMYYIED